MASSKPDFIDAVQLKAHLSPPYGAVSRDVIARYYFPIFFTKDRVYCLRFLYFEDSRKFNQVHLKISHLYSAIHAMVSAI